MIFNGTAQELADLTRAHWGAEWWPKGGPTGADPLSLTGPIGYEWNGQIVNLRTYHEAASIIFAAAFEFVSIRGLAVPLLWRDFKDENKWAAIIWGRLCEGPSPLHAILGAALEAAR